MSEKNPTPGEWVVHPARLCLVCTADATRIIADTESASWEGDHERASEDMANARLITAAKDLQAALEAVLDWSTADRCQGGNGLPNHLVNPVFDAINKAKGE